MSVYGNGHSTKKIPFGLSVCHTRNATSHYIKSVVFGLALSVIIKFNSIYFNYFIRWPLLKLKRTSHTDSLKGKVLNLAD